jgi:hypothetical protein
MQKKAVLMTAIVINFFHASSQQKIASYPVEFSKAAIEKRLCDSYILQEPSGQYFMMILKDNRKARYLLYNNKMQLMSEFSPADGLDKTVFNFDDQQYLGGTAGKGKFYFVYKVTDKKFLGHDTYYQIETVDPITKQVSNKQLFEISKDEKLIISFGNFGQYFSITVNNSTGELKLYGLNPSGESFIKSFIVHIPATSAKKKLTDFLDDIQLVSSDEEPGLDAAVEKVKLFYSPGKISILVNERDDPTHILYINTQNFSFEEKSIDHSSLTKNDRGKSYVNSYLFENRLFSLVLNKKNIRIAVYDPATGNLLKTHEINEDTDPETFAEIPFTENRSGGVGDLKKVDNPRKVIKMLDKGSEGIMVYKYNKGELIITIGTYDVYKTSYPGSDPVHNTYYSHDPISPSSRYAGGGLYTNDYIFRPGFPSITRYRANFYKSTQFKLMLDYSTLNLVNGEAPFSVNNKIKDYINNGKGLVTNQFHINEKQYIGFYNSDRMEYVIEEIFIRK